MQNFWRKAICLALILASLATSASCGKDETPNDPAESTGGTADTTITDTTAAPEPEPEPPVNDDGEYLYFNPLTGLPATSDISAKRPVAVSVNNIQISCPQRGIAKADMIYEVLAEGGITRLIALFTEYESLGELGSIRSAREYFIDIAAAHDAILVCAGGSPTAYKTLANRGYPYIDGVNMYTLNAYYRDPDRVQSMGYEHSLMVTGEGIKANVEHYKYATEIEDAHKNTFTFTEEALTGSEGKTLSIEYSYAQRTRFDYDASTGNYLRYQHGGKAHIDETTGEQLAFRNLLVLFTETDLIAGDDKNRIEIETYGTSGEGYYAADGQYIKIRWSRDSYGDPFRYETEDGKPLELRAGKTFVSIVPNTGKNDVTFG